MVGFERWPALVAGFSGTVVMTVMMQISMSAGITNMPAMTLITGSMVTGD